MRISIETVINGPKMLCVLLIMLGSGCTVTDQERYGESFKDIVAGIGGLALGMRNTSFVPPLTAPIIHPVLPSYEITP